MLATGAGSIMEKDEEKVKVNVTRELRYVFDDGDTSMARKLIQHGVVVCRLRFEERTETQQRLDTYPEVKSE